MAKQLLDVWVCVDSDGCYGCGTTRDEAREQYVSNNAELDGEMSVRYVLIKASVPLPVDLEAEVEVADDEGVSATA
jgi:hypothetical protein